MTNLPESPASPDQPLGGASPSAPLTVLVPDAVAALGRSSADYDALSDNQVLAGQALIADSPRALETCAAWMAATLARRSRPELGGKGPAVPEPGEPAPAAAAATAEPTAEPAAEPPADFGASPEIEAPNLQPGVIEGTTVTISTETLESNLCDTGILDVTFDDHGSGVDLGREQRTFTPAQRTALALRDGGCRWPGCDQPPSWTETHHIHHWQDDTGQTNLDQTNLDQGILLCRADHLRLHNEHWRITRNHTGQYWLTPPPGLDPKRHPSPSPAKTHSSGGVNPANRTVSMEPASLRATPRGPRNAFDSRCPF